MKLVLCAFFALTSLAQASYYLSVVNKDVVTTVYDKFPAHDQEVVITQAKTSGTQLILLQNLNELYVAYVDQDNSSLLKQTKLPFEIYRWKNIIFFQHVKHSEIEPLVHAHDLKLIKVSHDLKTIAPRANTPAVQKNQTDLEALYQHSKTQFDQAYLKDKLEQISGAKPANIRGNLVTIRERGSAAGRENVRKFLKAELEALGFRTWEHNYGNGGVNFVAQKDGADPTKIIVLSAHIDSVGNAGADDDGSGVAALIATAKTFSSLSHDLSLRILGYDQEEDGLVGSGKYFDSLAASGEVKNILGAIHYDMTGWDGNKDGKFHILDCKENSSPEIRQSMERSIQQLGIKLTNIPACRRRSDHIRYWQYSIPAVMAIEVREQDSDVNPCYHRSCDTVDTINFDYLNNITQVGALTLLQLTQAKIIQKTNNHFENVRRKRP